MCFLGGWVMMVDMISPGVCWWGLGPSTVLEHLGGPPDFRAVQVILSVGVFDEKSQAGRPLPLLNEIGDGKCGGHGPFEMMVLLNLVRIHQAHPSHRRRSF